jgi:hypothetical protein
MLTVNWAQPQFGRWYPLLTDFKNVVITGVYIIWHAGQPGRYVKVGQGKRGNVGSRLNAHAADREILAYRRLGELYVTWTTLPDHLVDGVERYLGDTLRPLVGDRFPDTIPIVVNLPG